MSVTLKLLEDELAQRREEGCDISEIEPLVYEANVPDKSELAALYQRLLQLNADPEMARQEPSELASIQALRPQGPRDYSASFTEDDLRDRILGAWLGRAAGCLLGKPCEGWHHDRIKSYLEQAGAYPLNDYFPLILPQPPENFGIPARPLSWLRGRVNLAPRDDDTDYTILGLHILEESGPDFTARNVAEQWLNHLPYWQVYTAERVAYANLVNGMYPPDTATHNNPYREWIGAQIRADMWGYVNPGRPEQAANMAFRDACLSHVRNGIYGEMWVAACLAAAFVERESRAVIEAGLAEIPSASRLAEAVRNTIKWSLENDDWDETRHRVNESYGHYHVVHTINNACAVVLALLHGHGDFEKTISIAVMCGWDTDCNGATAGSLAGMMLGASKLPEKWIAPLNDTLESAVQGFHHCLISDLAERTLVQAKALLYEA